DVNRSCLFKGYIRRFQRDRSRRAWANVFGERTASSAEYFITGFELSNVLADGFDCSGEIHADSSVLWFAQADSHQTYDLRRAFDEVPVVGIDRGCENSHEELTIIGNRFFAVLKLQMSQAVVAVDKRFHRVSRSSGVTAVVT